MQPRRKDYSPYQWLFLEVASWTREYDGNPGSPDLLDSLLASVLPNTSVTAHCDHWELLLLGISEIRTPKRALDVARHLNEKRMWRLRHSRWKTDEQLPKLKTREGPPNRQEHVHERQAEKVVFERTTPNASQKFHDPAQASVAPSQNATEIWLNKQSRQHESPPFAAVISTEKPIRSRKMLNNKPEKAGFRSGQLRRSTRLKEKMNRQSENYTVSGRILK